MSKASRQTIILLAVVNGIFITMDDYKLIPELAPTIDWGMKICKQCISKYPETGDSQKNFKWMQTKLQIIEKDLNNRNDIYTMIVLTSIASHIMMDLTEMIKDTKKLELIEPIVETVQGLSIQIDPEGDCFEAYEKADRLLKKIYNHLEFTR